MDPTFSEQRPASRECGCFRRGLAAGRAQGGRRDLENRGVTGSDADAAGLQDLPAAGCAVRTGHHAPPPADATCLVVSTAIGDDNPEVAAARAAGIRVVHRAQVLAALMDGCIGVAVAGTHGKSSTTAMLATIFTKLGCDPSYAIGATLAETGANAHHGAGPLFIAEADESDLSFLWLRQSLAVILNVEHDHPENYSGLDAHLAAYAKFADGIASDGILVTSADGPGADWRITGITASGMSSQTTVTTPGGQKDSGQLLTRIWETPERLAPVPVNAGCQAAVLGLCRGDPCPVGTYTERITDQLPALRTVTGAAADGTQPRGRPGSLGPACPLLPG